MKAVEKRKGIFQFFSEVRAEMRRVTWPTRRETLLTTAFVFVFALVAAIYFLAVDQVVYRLIQFIIHVGR